MSWDVAVYGELRFAKSNLAAWRKSTADPGELAKWPPDFTVGEPPPQKVDAILAGASAILPDLGFVAIGIDTRARHVRVRGHLVKDAYYDWAGLLAAAFDCAARLGGEGDLTFLGFMTIDFGYRVIVSPAGSKLIELDEKARRAVDASPEIAEITAAVAERLRPAAVKVKKVTRPTSKKKKSERATQKKR